MPKKILFTDMDGTLLDSSKKISPEMHALVQRMISDGAHFVLSSGRALSSIMASAEKNNLLFDDTLIIAANGNIVYDHNTRSCLVEKRVPLDIAAQIIAMADEMGIHIQSYDDNYFICKKPCPEVDYYANWTGMNPRYADDLLAAYDRPPVKLLAVSLNDKPKLEELRRRVLDRFSDTLTAIFSCNEYLEFFDKTAGKGSAVEYVCEQLQIPLSESVAAGDAENDISMLEAAGIAVVMANANDEVKKYADFITQKDNDHDGLSEAILHYFF
jgi:Cof subfamily protein (haloacid dehalogenase superfamily)